MKFSSIKVFDFELEDRLYTIYYAVCGHQVASCLLESLLPTPIQQGSTFSYRFPLLLLLSEYMNV